MLTRGYITIPDAMVEVEVLTRRPTVWDWRGRTVWGRLEGRYMSVWWVLRGHF